MGSNLLNRHSTEIMWAKRSLIFLVVAVFTGAGLFVGRGSETDVREVIKAVESGEELWAEENLYRFLTNTRRGDVLQKPETGENIYDNPNRIRILVIGDSFTFGTGLLDFNARWATQLEQELDRRTKEGVFEVVSIAAPGTSTYSHAKWLEKIEKRDFEGLAKDLNSMKSYVGEEFDYMQRKLSMPFDYVVVGYVDNDLFPLENELELTGEVAKIARQLGYKDPQSLNFVQNEDANRIYLGKQPDPNGELYQKTIEYIGRLFPKSTKVWTNLSYIDIQRVAADKQRDVFKKNGFIVGSDIHLKKLLNLKKPSQLMVTGVDPHPGTEVHRAYAMDLADTIMSTLSQEDMEKSINTATSVKGPLVSYFAPKTKISDQGTETKISYSKETTQTYICIPNIANKGRTLCKGGVTTYVIETKGGDSERTESFAPCLPLGQPSIAISLNPNLPRNSNISVGIENYKDTTPMRLYVYEYSESGEHSSYFIGEIKSEQTIKVKTNEKTGGFYLAYMAPEVGCKGTKKPLPEFNISLKLTS